MWVGRATGDDAFYGRVCRPEQIQTASLTTIVRSSPLFLQPQRQLAFDDSPRERPLMGETW